MYVFVTGAALADSLSSVKTESSALTAKHYDTFSTDTEND